MIDARGSTPPLAPRDLTRAQAFGLSLVLAVAGVAILMPGLLVGETFFSRDFAGFNRPMRELLVALWERSIGLPTWNPHVHFGQPFAANPNSAVFHPFSLAFLVLPFERAFQAQVLLPLAVAGPSMGFLLRTTGCSRLASLLGAATWAFGGVLISLVNFFQLAATACAMPLTLAFASRLVARPSAGAFVGLALSVGFQSLGGAPSMLLATTLAVVVVTCGRALRLRRRLALRHAALRLAGALTAGVLVGSVVLLPASGLALSGARATALHSDTRATTPDTTPADEEPPRTWTWSLPPLRLLELLVPGALGLPDPTGLRPPALGTIVYTDGGWPYLGSIAPGLLVTVLGLGAFAARRRATAPWALLSLLGLALALGDHLGLIEALEAVLPAIRVMRYPEKLAVLPFVGLTVAAGLGFDHLRRSRSFRRVIAGTLLGLGVALVPLSLLSLPVEATRAILVGAVFALLFALLTAAAGRGRARGGRRPSGVGLPAVVALVVAATLQLVTHSRELLPTAPTRLVTAPPAVFEPLLATPPAGYLFLLPRSDVRHARAGVGSLPIDSPVPARWGISTAWSGDFERNDLTWSVRSRRFARHVLPEVPELVGPLLARHAVDAVLKPDADAAGGLVLLATRDPRPLAFAARRVVVLGDPADRLAVLRELGPAVSSTVVFDESPPSALAMPSDPSGLAMSSDPDALAMPSDPDALAMPSDADVTMIERVPDRWRMRVTVTEDRPAVIALNQTWHGGWRASLDGEELPIHRADMSLQAVVVPPGEHVLELRHGDPLIAAGLGLTLLGLVTTLAGAGRLRHPPSHAAPPDPTGNARAAAA